jgi:hypothetical protein
MKRKEKEKKKGKGGKYAAFQIESARLGNARNCRRGRHRAVLS